MLNIYFLNFRSENKKRTRSCFLLSSIFIVILLAITISYGKKKPIIKIVKEKELALGVKYQEFIFGRMKYKNKVHMIEVDLINAKSRIDIMKAGNNMSTLAKLHNIINDFDSLTNRKVLGAVNGSFWRAYSSFPIGPTIIDGELHEIYTHKTWSSLFFDKNHKPYIDTFRIKAKLFHKNKEWEIDRINRRLDSNGINIYNHFRGDTIPFISHQSLEKKLDKALIAALEDEQNKDSTEFDFDLDRMRSEILAEERKASVEMNMPKYLLKKISGRGLNDTIVCIITNYNFGLMPISRGEYVLSIGDSLKERFSAKVGDTLKILYETNLHKDKIFTQGLSATPRLVREGKAKHEAYAEGSTGKRFINKYLPRTAIGYDKYKRKIYIVVVESSNKKKGRIGASLQQLSYIMKNVGCYDALNLDGGGSSVMVIDGKNIVSNQTPDHSRKISVGIGVTIPK